MRLFAAFSLFLLGACATDPTPPPLPALAIDRARVAVAGLSAGAYMATQVHLALNERIHGAALLAGGPYGCARGDLQTALSACMAPAQGGPDAAALAAEVVTRAADGRLAPLAGLAGDRVYVWHGMRDATVAPAMGAAAADVYRALDPALSIEVSLAPDAGHVLPTVDRGADCAEGGAPWLGRCGVDGAAAAVAALAGGAVVDANAPPAGRGVVATFDQTAYFAADVDPVLADAGYLYVPPQCREGRCGLLLVFHGCQQSAAQVGRAFVDDGGFNRAADAASLVVVYPQARASWAPLNPKACWDWWGYTGADYDTRSGAQIRFVAAVIDAIGG
jgi:poly(3-hydroxybutyrate) depolymerase